MSADNREDVVKLERIEKVYRLGALDVPVLKGIDICVKRGEFVGIMGASGSGKSTLLNILGLLDIPTAGKYYLDGMEVENLSDDYLAELRNNRIGFIFQSFNLFPHLTVEQNIEVPLVYSGKWKHDRRQIAIKLAEKVGLTHRLKHKPAELSGGECQRIAVARSLSNSPAFLLADEPTGNLDEEKGIEVMELFSELHKDSSVTILMVTHNPEYRDIFDRVIYLRDGKVVNNKENRT